MSQLSIVFGIAIAMICVAGILGEGDCPDNEIYNECGSACHSQLSCEVRFQRRIKTNCIQVCVPRCECPRGMIRLKAGGPCVDKCP